MICCKTKYSESKIYSNSTKLYFLDSKWTDPILGQHIYFIIDVKENYEIVYVEDERDRRESVQS